MRLQRAGIRLCSFNGKNEEKRVREGSTREPYSVAVILPGGQVILVESGEAIVAHRLDKGECKVIVQGGTSPHYLSSGHLVYHRAETLIAAQFDRRRLEISGAPVAVIGGLRSSGDSGEAHTMPCLQRGHSLYIPGTAEGSDRTMVWVDRQGVADPLPASPRDFEYPRVSSDDGAPRCSAS